MSGYNADYGIPAGDRDDAPEATPIEPVEEPKPYYAWETGTGVEYTDLDPARLLATVREQRNAMNKDIEADDWRLQHIWEQAGEIADRRGYCDVFDSIMDELGTGYKREVEYCVTVTETRTYDVHITAPRGADQRDIEELINDVDLSDWSETDREVEVTNYEVSD